MLLERPSAPETAPRLGRDRRTDARLTPSELSVPASIRIPNRTGASSLIDLSPGGALIDIPFQVRPDARLMLELRAASDRIVLPFRLLRCHVASLQGGVRYQAAGAFEERLDWKPLLGGADDAPRDRLIATLEAFLRHGSSPEREIDFDQLLMWILDAARRGERADRIAVEIRLHLGRVVPSVIVEPATKPVLPDPTRCARFFGLDFRSERPLSTQDRRLLRAAAQLLSIINDSDAALRTPPPLDFKPRTAPERPVIVYGADWKQMYPDDLRGAGARQRSA